MRLVISGTVGVGKSTTSKALVKALEEKGYLVKFLNEETVNSPYLRFYYDEPANWAFVAQIDFLLGRFKQWLSTELEMEEYEKNKKDKDPEMIVIYDRHFLDDYLFAELHTIKNNISQFNSLTYHALYQELLAKMEKMDARPDYFLLLKAPLEAVMGRLHKRGRDEEKEVEMKYWQDLYSNYYERSMTKNHLVNNVKKLKEVDTLNKTTEEIVNELIAIIKK